MAQVVGVSVEHVPPIRRGWSGWQMSQSSCTQLLGCSCDGGVGVSEGSGQSADDIPPSEAKQSLFCRRLAAVLCIASA